MKSDVPVSYSLLEAVLTSRHAQALISGECSHDAALRFTGALVRYSDDAAVIEDIVRSLLPEAYSGNTLDEVQGMLSSALKKGFDKDVDTFRRPTTYDPGTDGPIALGFTRDGTFALRDQVRNIIVSASPGQLLSYQFLLGLAPSQFWAFRFPAQKNFNTYAAGEALMAACRIKGPFNPLNIRGRGIWREGDDIIVNLGNPVERGRRYHYLCFEPIAFDVTLPGFDTARLLTFLRSFQWRNQQDAMLLLGWLAVAPICGVLNWRPHCFLFGPPRCGKTTIHALAGRLLHPLVISTDGQSSEAGIRQALGPDSLPIIIDEFESDQYGSGIRSVLRLARSASSADNPLLRGTPEGKAMRFSLRTSFFFCAVNPGRMSPADQSRILLLELLPHGDDPDTAKRLLADEIFFRELGPMWCTYMLSLAGTIGPAIDLIEPALPSADSRHRQNMSTLLAGAFVALNGRIPRDEEATAFASEYAASVESHAEDIVRDNSVECLEHLLAHVIDNFPLGHWIGTGLLDLPDTDQRSRVAERVLRTYDIVLITRNEERAVLIKNGSPNVEKVFYRTIWEGRAWERALRALDDAFIVQNPVYFPSIKGKSRCIGIPASFIPEPINTGADYDDHY